jgi:hypothetical protein
LKNYEGLVSIGFGRTVKGREGERDGHEHEEGVRKPFVDLLVVDPVAVVYVRQE